MTVTHSLLHANSVLLLSRTASTLSPSARRHFLRGLTARGRSGAVVFVARHPSVLSFYGRILEVRWGDARGVDLAAAGAAATRDLSDSRGVEVMTRMTREPGTLAFLRAGVSEHWLAGLYY